MSFTIWLLISHHGATIPGQWSFFMAPERTEEGMLISNRMFTKGYSLNPAASPLTYSTISLGIFLDQVASHEEKIRQIAAAVKIPERTAGAIVGVWSFSFKIVLVLTVYLGARLPGVGVCICPRPD